MKEIHLGPILTENRRKVGIYPGRSGPVSGGIQSSRLQMGNRLCLSGYPYASQTGLFF